MPGGAGLPSAGVTFSDRADQEPRSQGLRARSDSDRPQPVAPHASGERQRCLSADLRKAATELFRLGGYGLGIVPKWLAGARNRLNTVIHLRAPTLQLPEIDSPLHVQPAFGAPAEEASEAQGHIGSHRSTLMHDLGNRAPRHPETPGKLTLGEAKAR